MVTVAARVRCAAVLAAAWLGVCAAAGLPAENTAGGAQQQHSLTFVYEKPASDELQSLFETLRNSRILESWTGYVNRILKPLPRQIEAAYAECGKANSSYDPKKRRITLCYEEADRSFHMLNTSAKWPHSKPSSGRIPLIDTRSFHSVTTTSSA